MVPWLQILLGAVSLLAGKRLFWLFIALVGFVFGFRLTLLGLPMETHGGMALWVGLGVAVLGAVLAVLAQKVAVWVGGSLALGAACHFLLLSGLPQADWPLQAAAWAIGGVLGLLVAGFLFDFVLIAASVAWGAAMIVHALDLDRGMLPGSFIVLGIVGVLAQTGGGKRLR